MWRLFKLFKWVLTTLILLVVLLLIPVGYVEVVCRNPANQITYKPIIQDAEFQRTEANSYLTYPEWHIVYAYEGLAKVLETGDEHGFGYISSVTGFWGSLCDLNRRADRHGGGDTPTRQMVYTIGVSFTLEMAAKALYEETIGRLFTLIRGPEKSPQDIYSAKMAADYAQFLQQTPWYKYDFNQSVETLWVQPLTSPVRGWERRLALGGEWKAKAAYAQVIASAVAATGVAQLRIRSVVTDLTSDNLAAIEGVDIIESTSEQVIIETPRYRQFTRIVENIAAAGGRLIEIAGNNDIMVSALEPVGNAQEQVLSGALISRIQRDGYDGTRILVSVDVSRLPELLSELAETGRTLEHIYDY